MLALAATSSATPSLQATLNRNRLDQARREADQLEAQAQELRSEADQADTDAEKGQDKVKSLSIQNSNASDASSSSASSASNSSNPTYSAASQASSSEVPVQTQEFLLRMYQATSAQFAASGNALKTNANAAPVVNSQGQATGRIVNLQA